MNSDTVKAVDPKAKEVRALMDMHSDAYDLGRAFEAASSNAEKSAESSYLLGLFQYTGTCTAADPGTCARAGSGGWRRRPYQPDPPAVSGSQSYAHLSLKYGIL